MGNEREARHKEMRERTKKLYEAHDVDSPEVAAAIEAARAKLGVPDLDTIIQDLARVGLDPRDELGEFLALSSPQLPRTEFAPAVLREIMDNPVVLPLVLLSYYLAGFQRGRNSEVKPGSDEDIEKRISATSRRSENNEKCFYALCSVIRRLNPLKILERLLSSGQTTATGPDNSPETTKPWVN